MNSQGHRTDMTQNMLLKCCLSVELARHWSDWVYQFRWL